MPRGASCVDYIETVKMHESVPVPVVSDAGNGLCSLFPIHCATLDGVLLMLPQLEEYQKFVDWILWRASRGDVKPVAQGDLTRAEAMAALEASEYDAAAALRNLQQQYASELPAQEDGEAVGDAKGAMHDVDTASLDQRHYGSLSFAVGRPEQDTETAKSKRPASLVGDAQELGRRSELHIAEAEARASLNSLHAGTLQQLGGFLSVPMFLLS